MREFEVVLAKKMLSREGDWGLCEIGGNFTDNNQFYVVQLLFVVPVGYVWERVT